MLEFEFEMYDVDGVRPLPPCKPELAPDEGGADMTGHAADRVHRSAGVPIFSSAETITPSGSPQASASFSGFASSRI